MPLSTQGGQGAGDAASKVQEPNGIVWEVLTTNMTFLSAVCGESQQTVSSGVYGINDQAGIGVNGQSQAGMGVRGASTVNGALGFLGGADPVFSQHAGVYGHSDQQGVIGMAGAGGTGIFGGNTTGGGFGVRGETTTGTAVQGVSFGAGLAGRFQGDVEVTGDIRLTNKDCAEDFEMLGSEDIGPGTVVVIDSGGAFKRSHRAYDKRVAGVISGAGECRPGIILGREQPRQNKMPVALVGQVYCEVDAEYAPIEVGDLLTTSPTPGHAMKATEPLKAFGAVIGKALRPLDSGRGLIPILVALQ